MGVSIKNKTQFRVPDFSRGQNSSDEPSVLQQGYASKLENAVLTSVGKAEQRDGITRVGETPDELVMSLNFNNSTSSDNTGANTVTATSLTYVDGKFGKGAGFNGSGSNISIDASTTNSITDLDAMRLSLWLKGATDGVICDKYDSNAGYRVEISGSELKMTVGYDGTDAQVITSGASLSSSAFKRLDFLHNTDNSLDIYVDGTKQTYGTDTTGVGSLGDDGSINMVIASGTSLHLDDIRLYDGSFDANQIEMNKITGLGRYQVGTTLDRIYRANGTKFERLDDDAKDWTILSGSSFTADKNVEMVQAKDLLFLFQGGQNCISMDSSEDFTDEGNTNTDVPQGTTAEYMPNNRLFVSGSEDQSQRDWVWFSDALAPQTFDRATNVFKVRSGGGGAVKKVKRWRQNELVIYKEDSIYVLEGTNGATPLSDWSLNVVHPTIGCKAPRSVVSLGDEHIFLSDDGVRALSRTQFDEVRNAVLSKPVDDIINRINKDQISKACATFYDNKYILAIPVDSATENNYIIIWDSQAAQNSGDINAGWTVIPKNTLYPSVFEQFEFSDNDISLLYGDNRSLSLVYRMFNGSTDDGEKISFRLEGPQHTIDYVRQAIWNPIQVVADSSDSTEMIVYGKVDGRDWVQLNKVSVDTGGGIDLPVDLPFDFAGGDGKAIEYVNGKKLGRARTFQLAIEHNQYNKDFVFNEYTGFASIKGGPQHK